MKDKKKTNKTTASADDAQSDGIIGMLISMHTFPIESDEDLVQSQKIINEINDQSDQILNE